MGTSSKQVLDIKVTKGLASVGNEELRDWTEKGWNQAMREGNYDRSREHLNFEIRPGGIVAPIDKSRPLTRRMAERSRFTWHQRPQRRTGRTTFPNRGEFHLRRFNGTYARACLW